MEIWHAQDGTVFFVGPTFRFQLSEAQLRTLQAAADNAGGLIRPLRIYSDVCGVPRKFSRGGSNPRWICKPSPSVRATVSRMLRRLVEQGLLEKSEQAPRLWKITRAGRKIARAYSELQAKG
jgi:hypothetical protein